MKRLVFKGLRTSYCNEFHCVGSVKEKAHCPFKMFLNTNILWYLRTRLWPYKWGGGGGGVHYTQVNFYIFFCGGAWVVVVGVVVGGGGGEWKGASPSSYTSQRQVSSVASFNAHQSQ